jgi:hypothetical protein
MRMALEDGEYVGIRLWITSLTLSPDAISVLVGLESNYVQTRGTAVGSTSRLYERHSWSLGERLYATPNEQLDDLFEPFISRFLSSLEASASRIRALSPDHSVSIAIIFGARAMPYLGLTRQQVQAVAALGAAVNYDVVTYGDEA